MAEAQVATKSTPKQKPAASKAKKADKVAVKPDLVQTKAEPSLISTSLFQSATVNRNARAGVFKPSVQTKLKVGQPGDKYEQEADAVADKVVQARFQSNSVDTEEGAAALQTQLEEEPEIQAKPEEEPEVQMMAEEEPEVQAMEEEEPEVQMMAEEEPEVQMMVEEEPEVQMAEDEEPEVQMLEDEEPDVQAQAEEEPEIQAQNAEEAVQAKDGNGQTTDDFDSQLSASGNGGSPLSQSTISQVGPHLGADLSNVRVHTDSSAVQMNQQLGSQAFTHQNHVYFNEGKYNPGSTSGDHLIAHELTHTVQQGAAVKTKPEEETEDELQAKVETPELQKQLGDAPTDNSDATAPPPAASDDSSGNDTSDNTDNTPPPTAKDAGDSGSTPPSAPADDNNSAKATEPIAQDAQDLNKDNPIKPREATKAEEGQKVEKLALDGNSEEAMASFTQAGASQMAASLPGLGDTMNQKMGAEKAKEAAEAPVLTAGTTGVDDPKAKPVDAVGSAKNAALKDGVTEPEPAAQQVEPHKEGGPLPKYRPDDKLEKDKPQAAESGGFFSWLFDKFKNVMGGVKINDSGMNTKAGKTPKLDATGQANPERTANQTKEGKDQINKEKDKSAEEIKKNPGQENIQPEFFEEPNTLQLNTEIQAKVVTAQDKAMSDFVEMPMPEEVRKVADLDMAPTLEKSLLQPREQTKQAALKRDTEKQAAINDSQAQVEQLNKDAELQQKQVVDENRKAVADEQQRGINEANTQMNAFTTEADKEQGKANKAAKDRIKKDQTDADKQMKQAEADAAKEKKKGEDQAKAEKEKAKKSSEDKSWWGKFKDAVSSAVSWLTEKIGAIFKAIREAVKFIIDKAKNAALALIEAGRKWIVEKLDQFGNWLKEKANKYLAAFPALRDKVNGFIDKTVNAAKAAVNKIANGLKAGVEALAKGLTSAINSVLNAFETALTAAVQVAGALLKGDFTEALKIAFFATCKVAGIDPNPIMDFINNAGETINVIFKDPAAFFGHVVSGVKLGLDQFVTNIKKHLISGLIGWLTGAMSDVPIQMPEKFDLKGVFSLVMQILGLTYDRIRAKVVKRIGPKGEQVVSGMEQGFQFMKDLVTKGPIVLWEKVKEKFTEIKEMAMEKIRNLVTIEVVKAGIKWMLSLLNPASAIVKAVLMLFDFVMFLVDRKDQIMGFVSAVFGTVGPLARGQIKNAANAVEGAMGRGVPVILGLLANLAGLGGIGKSVSKVIKTIQKPVDKVVDPIIGWLVKQGKKMWKKGKAGAKKLKDKVFSFLGLKKSFKAKDGKSHKVFFKKKGKKLQIMMASIPDSLATKIQNRITFLTQNKGDDQEMDRQLKKLISTKAVSEAEAIEALTKGSNAATDSAQAAAAREHERVKGVIQTRLEALTLILIDTGVGIEDGEQDLPVSNVTFQMSGGMSHIVNATPLTKRAGNTTGTPASQYSGPEPPGWVKMAQKMNGTVKDVVNFPQVQLSARELKKIKENLMRAMEMPGKEDLVWHYKKDATWVPVKAIFWHRAHLLNADLHGPAVNWNIVPASGAFNAGMKKAEKVAKDAVSAGDIVSFKATLTRHDHNNVIANTEPQDDIRESFFAKSISIELKKKRDRNDPNYSVSVPVPATTPDPVPEFKLNFDRTAFIIEMLKAEILDVTDTNIARALRLDRFTQGGSGINLTTTQIQQIYDVKGLTYGPLIEYATEDEIGALKGEIAQAINTVKAAQVACNKKLMLTELAPLVGLTYSGIEKWFFPLTSKSKTTPTKGQVDTVRGGIAAAVNAIIATGTGQGGTNNDDSGSGGGTVSNQIQTGQTAPSFVPAQVAEGIQRTKGNGASLPGKVKEESAPHINNDLNQVRIHTGADAAALNRNMNSRALTQGQDIYFNSGEYNLDSREGKKLLNHELAHTAQHKEKINLYPGQKASTNEGQSIQTKLTIGQPNDRYEQEADQIADKVVNGANASQVTASTPHIQSKPLLSTSGNQIQRYAFVGGRQIDKAAKQPNATMQAWTADTEIRDYKNIPEFEKHAAGTTEHIGVLKTGKSIGTWVRFEESGINILGEHHNKVTLQDVTPAVGTTSFIRERFATDDFSSTPVTEATYEAESQDQFNMMNIAGVADKKKFGGESIYPKVAYALHSLIPLLYPARVTHLKSGTYPDGTEKYSGKPYQRYVKLGWAWSADNLIAFQASEPHAMTPARANLAAVHLAEESKLNPFFASLTPDGFIGDVLDLPANATIYASLKTFSEALLPAIYEMLANDASSPLPAAEKDKLKASSASTPDEKHQVIKDLRNRNIHNAVIEAAKNKVRYAGMGKKHLEYLQDARLQSGWHDFDMVDVDLKKFEEKTKKLKSVAK